MRESFFSGAQYPLRAAFFILRTPSIWPFCIAPLLINAIVVVLVWIWVGSLAGQWASHHFNGDAWYWRSLHFLAMILLFFLKLVASLAAFVIAGNIASAPFNDFLSEKVDKIASGWKDERSHGIGTRIKLLLVVVIQEAGRLAIYLSIMLPLFLLSFFPAFTLFTTAAQYAVSSMFFAVDYFAYPLERRGTLLLKQKFAFAREHLPVSLGFGAAMTLIALVPIVNFLFLPLGVVGGTLLFGSLLRNNSRAAG